MARSRIPWRGWREGALAAALLGIACTTEGGADHGAEPIHLGDAGEGSDAPRVTSPEAAAPPDARGPSERDSTTALVDAAPSPEGSTPPDAAAVGDAGLPPITCSGPGSRFVTGAVAHEFGLGQNVGQSLFPEPILGPPVGGGACQGSFDVVSLGNGGSVVVEFAGNAIVDGAGPDFIVFENAFGAACDPTKPFAELATVSVSDDGVSWHEFPCTAASEPYGQCAGWHVVYAGAPGDAGAVDPTDPDVAGGDAFDLADLGVAQARYVRIVDRPDLGGVSGVFDLDAVAIVNPLCP